jgi:Leucine-rich repeat (LRR) protein
VLLIFPSYWFFGSLGVLCFSEAIKQGVSFDIIPSIICILCGTVLFGMAYGIHVLINQHLPDEETAATKKGVEEETVATKRRVEAVPAKIRVARKSGVTELNLSKSQITNGEPLAELTNLRELNLGGNSIADLSFLADLTELRRLYLWDNQITDITPLKGLINLRKLTLSNNQIPDISPLASLSEKLTTLNLYGNQITDVLPLVGLSQLRELHLGFNPIADVTQLARMPQLQGLYLYPIRITSAQKAFLRKALPKCKGACSPLESRLDQMTKALY